MRTITVSARLETDEAHAFARDHTCENFQGSKEKLFAARHVLPLRNSSLVERGSKLLVGAGGAAVEGGSMNARSETMAPTMPFEKQPSAV